MTKKLLEEGSVRSFMKLANLEPLAEEFVKENYQELEEEEDEMEEGMYARDDEPEMGGEEGGEPMDDPMDEPMDEPEPDLDAAPAGGSENEEVFKDIVGRLADALGVEASIDGDGGEGEMEMPPEGDDELEMGDEEGEEGEEGDDVMENDLSGLTTEDLIAELESRGAVTLEEEEEPEEKEDEEEEDEEMMQEAIERISRRVADRLLKK